MPTYDYVCQSCGHELELFQSMSEKPKRKCPECGTLKLKRLIGAGGGLIFKGSGFYLTDYRSESYKKGAEAESKASESKGDSSKSDASSKSGDKKKASGKNDSKKAS